MSILFAIKSLSILKTLNKRSNFIEKLISKVISEDARRMSMDTALGFLLTLKSYSRTRIL